MMAAAINYFPNHYANGGWWHLLTCDGEKIELRTKREALKWLRNKGATADQLKKVEAGMKFREEVNA